MRLGEALALGLLHGPAELLPISSSAHTDLVPWLAGWDFAELDPELRKSFGVALHAGTAAALLLALRGEVAEAASGLDARRVTLIAGSFAVPAAVGLVAERAIEERLGGPLPIAAGLLTGAGALWWADRGDGRRRREDAGLADALSLGAAQACALWPGVSRNGATLTAARLRGFGRRDSSILSRHVALPVIAAATALKGLRLAQRGLPRAERAAFAGGTAAAFASTLASTRLVRDDRALWPFAAYRAGLALVVACVDARRRYARGR